MIKAARGESRKRCGFRFALKLPNVPGGIKIHPAMEFALPHGKTA